MCLLPTYHFFQDTLPIAQATEIPTSITIWDVLAIEIPNDYHPAELE